MWLLGKQDEKEIVQQLVPEFSSIFLQRYRILQLICISGPVGRRTIQDTLNLTERTVRNELTLLTNQGLIEVSQKGVLCTEKGYKTTHALKALFHDFSGLTHKEKQLAKKLGIQKVVIVPGDMDSDQGIKQLIGQEAVEQLVNYTKKGDKIAITGGSTVASLLSFLSPLKPLDQVTFVAARGSFGSEMHYQANTLASQFAAKTGAHFRTLFLPENLSETAYAAIVQEPMVKEVIEMYEQMDIVIHGIGTAKEMATRRATSDDVVKLLDEKKAIGEAFGYYFDENGEMIYRINTIGLQFEQMKKSKQIITVAGGSLKAKAIQAYFKNTIPTATLITDEGAANNILNDPLN